MRIIEIEGVGAETAKRLNTIGIRKTEDIKDWREIANIRMIGVGTVSKILKAGNFNVSETEIEAYRRDTRDVSKTEIIRIERRNVPHTFIVPKTSIEDDEEDEDEEVCMVCGEPFDANDIELFDDGMICEDCYDNYEPEHLALAKFLEENPDEISEETYDHWGLKSFSLGNAEYAVGTDDEADEAASECIQDEVWAFNSWFIASHVRGNVDDVVERYEQKRDDWYEAIRIVGEMQDLSDQIDDWNDDLDDEDTDPEELDDIQKEIDAAEIELEDLKKELDETDFDEDVNEDDYSWEDEFCEELAYMGFEAEAISSILMEGGSVEDVIANMQRESENANDALLIMIDDIDEFVDDAVSADGRGHFLSGYDGYENEEELDGETYYIYRTN